MVRVLHWLAPSVAGALLGAVIAGLVEAIWGGLGLTAAMASAGFAAIVNVPLCLIGALVVRALWAAWRPERFADPRRLAAWILFLVGAGLVLTGAVVGGVDWQAKRTAFKANVVVVVMPFVTLVTIGALAAISVPVVDLLDRGLRVVDRRGAITPRRVLAGTLVLAAVLALVARAWVAHRLGPYDLGLLLDPIVAGSVAAAVHPLWRRAPARIARLAIILPAVATLAIATAALWVRVERPSTLLAIWTGRSVGALAIDALFDVDQLRGGVTVERARPVPREGARHRDIVLVTIDTVRFDRTPLGGGPAPMPALAALGARGAVFERAYSPSNATGWSVPPMMLGASTPRVRGREVEWALRLDPRHVTVAERLSLGGYDTAGFFCCQTGWGAEKDTGWANGIDTLEFGKDREITDAMRAWLAARHAVPPERPAFAWIHLFEPHRWARGRQDRELMAAPRAERTRLYDKELTRVDALLGRLVDAIDAIPEDRRPILVISSDHGDGLGDHGVLHHGGSLYDSETRVPFVIVGPGIPAARIRETVSLVDLAPTLLDLAGFVPPGMPAVDGRSVADLATGARAADPDAGFAYVARLEDRVTPHGMRAVVRGPWKLIEARGGLELYDTVTDPGELRDLADERPDLVAELQALLAERAAIDRTPAF